MKIHKIGPSNDKNKLVLSTPDQPLTIDIFNETKQEKMNFARIGRVVRGIEVPRDLSYLYALGLGVGVQPIGDPRISSGRLHQEGGVTHNCIVVSFGEDQEYIVYCIHQVENWEIYDLYQSIQETSRKAVSERKASA